MLGYLLNDINLTSIMKLKILFILMSFLAEQASAFQLQSPESINAAIRLYVSSTLASDSDYKLTLSHFDSRLKLRQCNKPLEIFTHNNIQLKPGRNSVGIRCNTKKKWTIYTSAIINLFQNVLVLTQPVRRGHVFSEDMFQIEKRDVSTLRSGFMTNPLAIINKQATRNLNFGSVLNKSNYTEPKLIKKGDAVIINASSNNLTISMAGIAVMDGIKGQKIKVKNIRSRQIIQATVEKQGQVLVLF